MARKSKPHDEELPFVALMDTMTNVVGVLIIVLVLIGLGLAKSVKKILSDLPLVSEEEHQKLKSDLEPFKDLQDPEEVQSKISQIQAELAKILEALKLLQEQQLRNPVVLTDLDKLAKQLETTRKERDTRKTTVDGLLAEIDKLKVKLDTTPPYVPPAPIGVRLPSPRPMPEKAELHRFFISEGRVMYVDHEKFKKDVEMELRRGNKQYTIRQDVVKDAAGKPVMKKEPTGQTIVQKKTVYDPAKLADFFNKQNLGNRDTKVEVIQQPNSANVQLRIVGKPGGGETVDQIKTATSQVRAALTKVGREKNAVFWFHVCRDSIPSYLQLRDLVDASFPTAVGWDLTDKPIFAQTLSGDFLVDFTPAPPKPVDPNKPPAVNIAAPKMNVD